MTNSRMWSSDVESYLGEIQSALRQLDGRAIDAAVALLHSARKAGAQVFTLGNGGSASTASHMACDLGKNTQAGYWPHFRIISLSDNMALFSALANDDGYDNVFARQLAPLVQTGDVLIAISTSGNSPNVLRAAELATARGARTIGMTGYDGGRLGAMSDVHLHVPNYHVDQVEDVHLILEHLITRALRDMPVGYHSANGKAA